MPASTNNIGVLANFLTPRGFEKLDLSGGAQSLTPPDLGPIQIIALIQPQDGDARYRDDDTAPTDTLGFLLFESQSLQYNVLDLDLISFIADATNPADCINVNYYTYATLEEIANPDVFIGCAPLTINLEDSNNTTININEQTVDLSNIEGGASSGTFSQAIGSNINFAGIISVFECTIDSISSTVRDGTVVFSLGSPFSGSYVTGATIEIGTGADGTIKNVDGVTAASGLTFNSFPYTFHIEADDTGAARFTDTDGRDIMLAAPFIFDTSTNTFDLFITPPTDASDSIVVTVNGGDKPFVLPINDPNAVPWCANV